jgi:parallel beta-helix repeat protein
VENNLIYSGGNGSSGFRLYEFPDNTIVSGNIIHDVEEAISLDTAINATLANNILYSNKIGLQTDYGTNLTIRDNQAYRNTEVGIQVKRSAGTIIQNNQVWSNGSGVGAQTENSTLGTQSGLGANQVRLNPSASSQDGYYNNMYLYLDSGIGSPSPVRLSNYNGTTKVANVWPNWATQPNEGDAYHIIRQGDAGIRLRREQTEANDAIIRGNTIRGNNGFGIAIADYGSGDSATISDNIVVSNSFTGVAIGVLDSAANQGTFTIDNSIGTNYIRNNGIGASTTDLAGGIGITEFTGSLTIGNNEVVSNSYAGIQIRNMDASSLTVTNNKIHSNGFAGLALYDVMATGDAIFGPGNSIKYNGNASTSCTGLQGTGSGDGGVAVRDLDAGDVVRINGNTIEDNNIGSVTRRDCGGSVYLDNNPVSCDKGTYWDENDAVVFVSSGNEVYVNGTRIDPSDPGNSAIYSGSQIIIDSNISTIPDPISGGSLPWGVCIAGGATNVVVRNCNITGNNTSCNSRVNGNNMGGGLFIGPGAEVEVYNNDIYQNGCETPPEGRGGSAGIVMRCSDSNSEIYSNKVRNNEGDGVDMNGGASRIGSATRPQNKIYSNKRYGVGFNGSGSPEVGYSEIYQNQEGGIGFYQVTGSPQIYSCNIHDNTGANNPGGVGIKYLNAGAAPSIRNNTIINNTSSGGDVPAGIGVLEPTGGTVYIDNNVIASNWAASGSEVGGIGLRGTSAANPGTLDNVYITSNRISNHRSGTGNQAGIGFKWLDFTGTDSMMIRNNKKDGVGISNNGVGVRFRELAQGVKVNIITNRIQNNVNPGVDVIGGGANQGGTAIEFALCNNIDVEIDSNYIYSNRFNNVADNQAAVAFFDCQLYSWNSVVIRRNYMDQNWGSGVEFYEVIPATTNDVVKIYVGSDQEAPGTSNDIRNVPDQGKLQAVIFKNMQTLGGIKINVLNNKSLDGGILFKNSMAVEENIIGNRGIVQGAADTGEKGAIQFKNNKDPGRAVTIRVEDNEIYDNSQWGIILKNPFEQYRSGNQLIIKDNVVYSCGYAGITAKGLANADTFIFSNNEVYDTGWDSPDNTPSHGTNGVALENVPRGNFTGNVLWNNKGNGLGFISATGNITINGGEFYDNGFFGFGMTTSSATVTVENAKFYSNGSVGSSNMWAGIGIDSGTINVQNCFVYRNNNKGIGIDGGTANVYFSTIADNANYGLYRNGGTMTAKSCIIWGNGDDLNGASATYSDIEDGDAGTGNISQNPLFVNPAVDDYHLQSSSPCIDYGADVPGTNDDYDFDGDSRPYDMGGVSGGDGSEKDMGADEYWP